MKGSVGVCVFSSGELYSLRPMHPKVTHRDDWCQEPSGHTVPLESESPASADSSL